MAELLAGIFELFVGFLELLPAILEILLYLVIGTFTVIFYFIWPGYRRKREQAWGGKRWKKYTELVL